MNVAGMRKEYALAGLRRADLASDPITQFRKWFADAQDAQVLEPNAMTLATVDAQGCPAARIVLFKGLDHRGFHFFTNYGSAKSQELEANPKAALVFHWVAMERQVRIRGRVSRLERADTEAYFQSRPRGSQLGAWVSAQSTVIANREALEQRLAELEREFAGREVPAPPFWGGFGLRPFSVEFWQGRPNRLHDRFCYTLEPSGSWRLERLGP